MGRPLNKKFMGNRNIGSTGTGDNYGIGGEGLAAYTLAVQKGSLVINATYPQLTLVIPESDIPSGVHSTATVVWEVESVTVAAPALNGHSYTTTTGGATHLTGLSGPTFNITAVGSGQGEVQTIVPVNRGEWTTIPRAAVTYQIVGGDGGNQATVKYRVKSITTVEKGSGYIRVPSITWNDGGSHNGTMPGNPTVALTTDSGNVGSATNQENAISIKAWLPAYGAEGYVSGAGGSSEKQGDIVRQTGNGKFLVRTADGVGRVKLVANRTWQLSEGEANIIAKDVNGGKYFVTRISDRRCNIIADTGTMFDTGEYGINVPWTFNGTSGTKVYEEQPYQTDESVRINNA